jgi:hypothetical protein
MKFLKDIRIGKERTMARKKKKREEMNLNELAQTMRRNWNGVNPVTRIEENKKRKPIKHKKRELEKESEV